MEGFGEDVVALLKYLTPGFLAAWIFYSLTSHQPSHQFERVIQALIFTFFINGSISFLGFIYRIFSSGYHLQTWLQDNLLLSSTISAIAFGLLASYVSNTDKPYIYLRRTGITKQSAYLSTWSRVFSNNVVYVVLHLQDGKRIYGWPEQWPPDWNNGHFALKRASWLSGKESSELTDVRVLLIDVNDVRWVEFIDTPEGARTDAQPNSHLPPTPPS